MTDLCFNANPSVNVSKNLISRASPTTLTSNPDWVVPRSSSLAIRTASGKVSPMVIGLHGPATGFVSFATHGSGKSYPIHRPVVSAKARLRPGSGRGGAGSSRRHPGDLGRDALDGDPRGDARPAGDGAEGAAVVPLLGVSAGVEPDGSGLGAGAAREDQRRIGGLADRPGSLDQLRRRRTGAGEADGVGNQRRDDPLYTATPTQVPAASAAI